MNVSKMKPHNLTIIYLVLSATIFIFGIFVGRLISSNSSYTQNISSVREGSEDYTFINPLLFTKSIKQENYPEYQTLKDDIAIYIEEAKKEKKIGNSSVYFRNLDGGEWFSINPDERYQPASMFKVITLITVMRLVEIDPGFLNKKVQIMGDDTKLLESQSRYPIKDPIRSGNVYSVDTLIKHLIIDSDNIANTALIDLVGKERIDKTYSDLELPLPDDMGLGYTTQQYSRLFRVLYNGTYVSHSLSEKILNLLSKTNFTHGIVAGVPDDIIVSHKFGIKTIDSIPSTKELHDCGIVYKAEHPYFICIMTKGDDYDELENVIQDVSKIVWSKTK